MRRLHRSASKSQELHRALAAALLGWTACATPPVPIPIPSPAPQAIVSAEIPANWPAPPAELERRLAEEPIELRAVASSGAGTTGALKFTVFFPAHGDTMKFKWKPVPEGNADGWNNAPRKELAAYALQKWFLDPPDYVVPTSVLRCLPIEMLESHGVAARPSIPGASCTLGVLSIWLDEVTVPEQVLEPALFASDAQYAKNVARFNLFTHLIEHQDGRGGNILASKQTENRRVFAVDNGIAFGALIHNYFVANWDVIRVPALPASAIDRLRRVGPDEIDQLGVLVELRADPNGMLETVTPGPNRDPKRGARVAPGWLQLGLTRSELDALEARLHALLARVDRGDLPVF